ncbi:MAG: hypothetical protein IPL49_07715 [Saprospirales bacterium]|nr:hypothetical protein [Saprospirales bacterium]
MRKARIKMVLLGLFSTLTLMLFVVAQGQAQVTTSYSPPSTPTTDGAVVAPTYVQASQGIAILEPYCVSLKTFLSTLTPGTQAYKTAETSYTFYTMILSGLQSGKNVPDSIKNGFTLFQYPDYVNTPVSQINSLRAESLVLLTI